MSSQNVKPAKLTLTPHHLYYLLSTFEDLGVDVGPTNVRLENLNSDAAPSNYVSFLGHAPKSKGRQSDADSLRSVSSVRSVISSVSSLWSNFSLSNSVAKQEKRMAQYREDVKYLYSCFTKIPALKLSPDHRTRLIAGYEEFPFDTAVPLFTFKNLSALEICDLDFRQFHGWDRMSEQLHSLTVKRAGVDDPIDLLQNIVLDDIERRRKRSSKTQLPTTPSTPGAPWPSTNSPRSRQGDLLARSYSTPQSPTIDQRRGSMPMVRAGSSGGGSQIATPQSRQRSNSPIRPTSSRHGSLRQSKRSGAAQVYRRSSGSSGSSTHEMTPRHSMPDLLALGILPPSKWRFLRHLSLAENGLTSLSVESLKPIAGTLQSLDLSGNLFKQVPDGLSSLTHLRALNLSNNMIDDLRSLARDPLPAVTVLNLRSNRLSSLVGIEKIPTLERVDLRDNRLRDPAELRRLTNAMELVDVYVVKNPFTRSHSNYRVEIFNAFRDMPGHPADVSIDTLAPTYNEKKQLHSKALEPVPVPVVQPPTEEYEAEEETVPGAEDDLVELAPSAFQYQDPQTGNQGHRRSVSDMGSIATRRRKKAPRRRIIELSQQEGYGSSPREPSLLHSAEIPPETPNEVDEPTTPTQTPFQPAPATQTQTKQPPQRPSLDTAFTAPVAATPKIRDPSDDDDSPIFSPQRLDSDSDLYRQKIEALKQELGPNWLTALSEDRLVEQRQRERSFSPSSRTSTVRPRQQSRGVSTGRTVT